MEHATFAPEQVLHFADLAMQRLSEAREEIDALNVYPVPDGDTGTNMYLTVESARAALTDVDPDDLGELLHAYARGALLGARGNSGVILSQLVGALFRTMARSEASDRSAAVFADGLVAAADAAYAAVGRPVEGTMLSVARAAADGAVDRAADPEARLADVVVAAAAAAREALARTPEQLAVLRDSGVVDAGGQGLCVILDAAEIALTGRHDLVTPHRPIPRIVVSEADLSEDGPAYEVMYLLDVDTTGESDSHEAEAIGRLRETLNDLGDSLVVVGGEGLWNVHVHVDDVGSAIEAGIVAGRPHRIAVTHFAEQVARSREKRASERRTGRALVAVSAGAGLAALFREVGATVVESVPGRRPSTGEILESIVGTGAAEVVVLPNDPDTIGVAQAAAHEAEETGLHVVVLPTRAQVQGIAALAVHEPGRPLDADVVQMTAAARGARHGAVTIAAKQAMTSAGPCEVGDVLGAIQGDFALVGQDLFEVSSGLLRRLLDSGGELVTLVSGEDGDALAEDCREWVERTWPGVDVVVHHGGQPRYPLLVAVE